MRSPRLALSLRRLLVVALAVPAGGCVIQNPVFAFDTESTSAATATTDGAATMTSSAGTVDTTTDTAGTIDTAGTVGTGGTEAMPTTSGDGTSTSTSASTLPPDTGVEMTTFETSDSSTGVVGCANPVSIDIKAVEDAFFISGSTDNQLSCKYYDLLPGGGNTACYQLNFGTTAALRLARMDDGIDAMYAVRFDQAGLGLLDKSLGMGAEFDHLELLMTGYDTVDQPIKLQIGLILDLWAAGSKNGVHAEMGDSNFALANLGILDTAWSGNDGPRGASKLVSGIPVDIPDQEHFTLVSDPIPLNDDFVDQLSLKGLVVYYPKETPVNTFGPGLKTIEAVEEYRPILRAHLCVP